MEWISFYHFLLRITIIFNGVKRMFKYPTMVLLIKLRLYRPHFRQSNLQLFIHELFKFGRSISLICISNKSLFPLAFAPSFLR